VNTSHRESNAGHRESRVTRIGLIGAGSMGASLGWALAEGGEDVVTTLAGRSARTAELVRQAGLRVLPELDAVVATASVLLVITPPQAALDAATAIGAAVRRTGARPLVADLNAVAPSTMEEIGAALAGTDLVDGAISGGPPREHPGASIFLAGPRAGEVAELGWRHVTPVVVGDRTGMASAVKMCTASVYKGLTGILTQALRAAVHYGVIDHVLADLDRSGYQPARPVALAATKAWRFVDEMHQIALAQGAAGLPAELFEAMAVVYAELARTELAHGDPESVDPALTATDVVSRLHP
jgi:3-hydroxyisobutyrate dehydrogenase-like beta-hydroxyacid dehydrogenase